MKFWMQGKLSLLSFFEKLYPVTLPHPALQDAPHALDAAATQLKSLSVIIVNASINIK